MLPRTRQAVRRVENRPIDNLGNLLPIDHVQDGRHSSLILLGWQFHGRASFQRSLGWLRARQH
jgi:hypothetical protein